jgi:threonine dehydrogenase-like Zn-dependent dehydrogenase
LGSLAKHFGGENVKIVKLTGDVGEEVKALQEAADGSIDAVFEISPPMAAASTHLKSAIMALRHGGKVSLMGGILEDYALPIRMVMRYNITIKGQWMCERADVFALMRMVESGALKIGEKGGVRTIGKYKLKDWEEAFEVASNEAGWETSVVMRV